VLEKDGEDKLDRSCENEELLQNTEEERNIQQTIKRRKA